MELSISPDILMHNQTVLATLEPGDMVEIDRGIFSHWAVYEGNENVIHVTGAEEDRANQSNQSSIFSVSGVKDDKAKVVVENFWRVTKNCKAKKNNERDNERRPLPKSEIVKRAKSMLGDWDYHALLSNCEHFASLCRYGEEWSDQANKAIVGGAIVGGVIVGGLLLGHLLGYKKERDEDDDRDDEENKH